MHGGRSHELLMADLRDLQLAGRLPIALATVHDAAKKARRDLEDKATVAGARHVLVSRTVLVECVSPRRDTLRDGADGTRLEGRGSAARLAHSSQRPRLRKVGHGSTRNFLANTRAPSSLGRARCGRTSNFVIVPRRAA